MFVISTLRKFKSATKDQWFEVDTGFNIFIVF